MSADLDWRIEVLLEMAAESVRDMLRYPAISLELEHEAKGLWIAAVVIAARLFDPDMHWREWRDAVIFPLVGTQLDKTVYAERAA